MGIFVAKDFGYENVNKGKVSIVFYFHNKFDLV